MNSFRSDDDEYTPLRSPEDAMKIVSDCAYEMCGGDVPTDRSRRLALLFAAVSRLTCTTMRAVARAREQFPDVSPEEVTTGANAAMSRLIAGATSLALAIPADRERDSWYDEMFSSEN